jgi:DNA-binding FadR family transcriptional regulator
MQKTLRGQALYKSVRDYIKNYIIEENLQPGDPLPSEVQLAEDLGVGRGSVREAVKSLQSLGIVGVQHGTGLSVREPNFDLMSESFKFGMHFNARAISELLQIRIWLETAVIGDAVNQIDAAALQELDSLLDQWEQHNQEGKAFTELDEAFHRTLYAALENQTLIKLFDAFWDAFFDLESEVVFDSDPADELRAHRRILDAVHARDPQLARQALSDHFNYVRERIEQYRQSMEEN